MQSFCLHSFDMAKTLTLREVPETTVKAIRERARRNHRSMQKEILAVLNGTVLDRASLEQQLSALRVRLGVRMKIADIDDAIAEGRP